MSAERNRENCIPSITQADVDASYAYVTTQLESVDYSQNPVAAEFMHEEWERWAEKYRGLISSGDPHTISRLSEMYREVERQRQEASHTAGQATTRMYVGIPVAA